MSKYKATLAGSRWDVVAITLTNPDQTCDHCDFSLKARTLCWWKEDIDALMCNLCYQEKLPSGYRWVMTVE